jgi:DNA-binding transcriptional LysR family regulator
MELYQLEHFVAVVEEHSFTRAAERVFRTQGAVSVAVRKLEEELRVPLIVRDSHECALTDAGHALLAYARRIIELRDKMQRSMTDYRNLEAGRVSIAAHESAAEYLLRAPLAAFHTQHPTIRLEARLCDGQEIAHLVFGREVDLGFGIRQASLHGLSSDVVHADPLVLVVGRDHRLGRHRTVEIAALAEERFFMHSRHSPMTVTVRQLFADHHVPLNIAADLWNFEIIKAFVRMGSGVAIVPASVVQLDLESGSLVAVRVNELAYSRSIEVIHRQDEALLPAPAALLELLRLWDWRHECRYGPAQPASPTDYQAPARVAWLDRKVVGSSGE